jgi:hypothetical protein
MSHTDRRTAWVHVGARGTVLDPPQHPDVVLAEPATDPLLHLSALGVATSSDAGDTRTQFGPALVVTAGNGTSAVPTTHIAADVEMASAENGTACIAAGAGASINQDTAWAPPDRYPVPYKMTIEHSRENCVQILCEVDKAVATWCASMYGLSTNQMVPITYVMARSSTMPGTQRLSMIVFPTGAACVCF